MDDPALAAPAVASGVVVVVVEAGCGGAEAGVGEVGGAWPPGGGRATKMVTVTRTFTLTLKLKQLQEPFEEKSFIWVMIS